MSGATHALAEFVADRASGELPAEAAHAGRRTVANAVALAAAAAEHPAVVRATAVVRGFGGRRDATRLGAAERLPVQWAAFANGMATHVEDFDDTHLATVIHPGAPIVPAALAVGELTAASGAQVLDAVVLGMEVALRIGLGAGSGHFDRGWHLTGTTGHFGAAAAAARLLRLDAERTAAALGIAGTQVAGLQVALGSMTKALHPGKAAANGVEAALLVERGLTAPRDVIEGRRGFAEVTAPAADVAVITDGLGARWEAEANAFKPYACGIVSHPALDAAVALRDRVPDLAAIERIVARVNPVVLDVMGVRDPRDGLQSKFSVYHCVAVGLIDGAGSPVQFSDAKAVDPEVRRVRARVHAELDPELARDAASVTVELRDGHVVEEVVEHARGSATRPLTDAELRGKAAALIGAEPGDPRVAGLMDRALAIDELDGLGPLVEAAARYAA